MPIQAELVLQLMMSLIEVAFLGAQQLCLGSLFQRIPLGIRPGCSSALQLLAALGMVIRSSVMGCWSPDVVPAVAAAPSVLPCGFCCRNPAGEAAGSSCFSDLKGVSLLEAPDDSWPWEDSPHTVHRDLAQARGGLD